MIGENRREKISFITKQKFAVIPRMHAKYTKEQKLFFSFKNAFKLCLQSEWACEGIKHTGTMYGILLESVQHFVQKKHGEEAWLKVMEEAGLHGVFTTHSKYR